MAKRGRPKRVQLPKAVPEREENGKDPLPKVQEFWLRACKDASLNSVFDLESHFGFSAESARWWSPDFERKDNTMLEPWVSGREEEKRGRGEEGKRGRREAEEENPRGQQM
ncbi:hypothetical protein Dimus_004926 [Dionaea muscipula]